MRKQKITVVALLEPSKIEERIKHHKILKLSEGIQEFYNFPCAKIITDNKYIDETINLLVENLEKAFGENHVLNEINL